MQAVETYTFVDKETGDLIQTGTAGDYSLSASQTRAIADFHSPVGVFHSFDIQPSKNQFSFEYAPSEVFNTKDIKVSYEIETVSPCAKKPRVLAPTHFYVQHPTFHSLKSDIEKCLRERRELVFSVFSRKQMWKCKYLEGSQSREMHVQCFWDGGKKAHLVEVKRVHGDGLFPQHTDLVTLLKQGLGAATIVSSSSASTVRRIVPPPSLSRGGAVPPPVTNSTGSPSSERFAETLRIVSDMSKHPYNEPRLESSKMLCDIISKQSLALLESSDVQSDVLDLIHSFLHDQNESVTEFGVVATHALLSKSLLYRRLMIEYKMGNILGALIAQIRNPTYNEETGEDDFYQYAQMRRYAGEALSMLVKDCCGKCVTSVPRREFLARILQQSGFFTPEDWRDYTLRLEDDVLRKAVMSVADCYC